MSQEKEETPRKEHPQSLDGVQLDAVALEPTDSAPYTQEMLC